MAELLTYSYMPAFEQTIGQSHTFKVRYFIAKNKVSTKVPKGTIAVRCVDLGNGFGVHGYTSYYQLHYNTGNPFDHGKIVWNNPSNVDGNSFYLLGNSQVEDFPDVWQELFDGDAALEEWAAQDTQFFLARQEAQPHV